MLPFDCKDFLNARPSSLIKGSHWLNSLTRQLYLTIKSAIKDVLCTSHCIIFRFRVPQQLQSNFSSSKPLLTLHPASLLARKLWWEEQSFEIRQDSRTHAADFLHGYLLYLPVGLSLSLPFLRQIFSWLLLWTKCQNVFLLD